MKCEVEVIVKTKPEVPNPVMIGMNSKLQSGGFEEVVVVDAGRYFKLTIDSLTSSGAKQIATSVATRLLANPVYQDFEVELS